MKIKKWVRLVKTGFHLLIAIPATRWAVLSYGFERIKSHIKHALYSTAGPKLCNGFLKFMLLFHVTKVMISKSVFHEMLMRAEGLCLDFQVNTGKIRRN